ncbi:MAG: lytic transglycosylase domain-containing protein [Syntrophotaleaceae bacterium]
MSIKSLSNHNLPANTSRPRPDRTGPQADDFASSLGRILAEQRESRLSRPALEAKLLTLSMSRSVLADESDSVQDYFPGLMMSSDARMTGAVRSTFSCHNYGNSVRSFDPPPCLSEVPPLDEIIDRAASTHGVDRQLIRAVIRTESNFNPQATSPAGAQGLMQLMPQTAQELGVTDPFNSEQNVMAGTRYLRQLLDRYEGDLDRALAAYNWGMGNLERKGMDQMPRETRDYLARVKEAKGRA